MARRKGGPVKVFIAQRLPRETTMTLAWIAQRLQLGTKTYPAASANDQDAFNNAWREAKPQAGQI